MLEFEKSIIITVFIIIFCLLYMFVYQQPQVSNVIFKCRICQGDHMTINCPFKHTQIAQAKANEIVKAAGEMPLYYLLLRIFITI